MKQKFTLTPVTSDTVVMGTGEVPGVAVIGIGGMATKSYPVGTIKVDDVKSAFSKMAAKTKENRKKLFKTLACCVCFMSVGLSFTLQGPTLLDLQIAVQSSLVEINWIFSINAIGYMVGTILAAITLGRYNVPLCLASFALTVCLMDLITPWLRSLPALFVISFILNTAVGAIDSGCNFWVLNIWGEENPPYMQALHFTFGLGSFLAPLISQPFLIPGLEHEGGGGHGAPISLSQESTTTGTTEPAKLAINMTEFLNHFLRYNTTQERAESAAVLEAQFASHPMPDLEPEIWDHILHGETGYEDEMESLESQLQLEYPYSIAGTLCAIVVGLFVSASFLKEDHGDLMKRRKSVRPTLGKYRKIATIGSLALFSMCFAGAESVMPRYLTIFAVKSDFNLSSSTGALMTAAFWGAYTFSRLGSVFYVPRLGLKRSLFLSLTLILIGNVILMLSGSPNSAVSVLFGHSKSLMYTGLWVGVVIVGIGASSVFPLQYGLLEQIMPVTTWMASSITLVFSFGTFIYPFMVGGLIEYYPMVLFFVTGGCGLGCVLFLNIFIKLGRVE